MAIFYLSLLLSITILLSLSSFPSSSSSSSSSSALLPHQRHLLQSNSPQNIETLFPSFSIPAIPSQTPPPTSSPPPQRPPPTSSPIPVNLSPTPSTTPKPSPTTNKGAVAKAVVATAASTLVVSGLLFFFLQRCALARRRPHKTEKTPVAISSPAETRRWLSPTTPSSS